MTNAQAFVLPPRRFKRGRVPGRVRGDRWNVKVTAEGAVPPVEVGLRADSTFRLNREVVRNRRLTYFKSDRVEPVSNIGASNSFNWLAEFSLGLPVLS